MKRTALKEAPATLTRGGRYYTTEGELFRIIYLSVAGRRVSVYVKSVGGDDYLMKSGKVVTVNGGTLEVKAEKIGNIIDIVSTY